MEMTEYPPGTPSWVDLLTPDVAASSAFYSGLFGWEVPEVAAETSGYRTCRLRGKAVAGLSPMLGDEERPAWSMHISSADVEATHVAVLQAGGAILMEPMPVREEGRLAVFGDPVGAAFEVWQPLLHQGAELVNEPGTFCWSELNTRQPELAIPFYRAVFGWEADVAPGYTQWRLGERPIAGMITMDKRWPAGTPSYWSTYFAVADLAESTVILESLGGIVHVPATRIDVGTVAMVSDPQETVFWLIQLAERS